MSDLHLLPSARARAAATPRPGVPRPWLRGATLAAATALGALVGFGMTDGASLGRLGVVTLRLRGLPEFIAPDRGAVGSALLGGAYAALTSGAWGAGLALLAGALGRHGVPAVRVGGALAAAALLGAAADPLLPTPLRLAAGALAPGERVLTALLVAAAAWGGVRLADASDA